MPPDPTDTYQTPSLYTDPVIYDILHAPGTAQDLTALERIAADYAADAPDHWLEPACGTGRYLRLAAKRGHAHTTGFDLEPAMIEDAAKRAARANLADRSTYFVADMRDFAANIKPKSIGFAFNLINTVRHLETDKDTLAHLQQTARTLHPRGVYAVGISITTYGLEPPSEDLWEAARGPCHVSQLIQYLPPTDPQGDRAELVYSHLTITLPSGVEHTPAQYTLRAYDLAQWTTLIEQSALKTVAVTDALGNPCDPPELGYALWILAPR